LESPPDDSGPTLVVINAQADLAPSERSAASIRVVRSDFSKLGVAVMTALDLLTRVRECGQEANPLADHWKK
jgi:hypothetical protein